MKRFFDEDDDSGYGGSCDICGAPLDPEDESIHLCKVCQGTQFNERQNGLD